MLFAPMVSLSAPMATHAASLPLVGGVVVCFQKLFAAVTEYTAVQMDTRVMLQMEVAAVTVKAHPCYRRYQPQREIPR